VLAQAFPLWEKAQARVARIGIPKHFLRPRERPSWSPPSTAREPRRNAPAPGGARRCTVLRGFGWCWTGAAGWGRVVLQGCPGATASERATGKAGGARLPT
jgi:hypothetical protein